MLYIAYLSSFVLKKSPMNPGTLLGQSLRYYSYPNFPDVSCPFAISSLKFELKQQKHLNYGAMLEAIRGN